MAPQHKGPVAVAGAEVGDGPAGGQDAQDLEGLARRHGAAKVVHEHWQHRVRHAHSLRGRVRAAPLQASARPGPEGEVRVCGVGVGGGGVGRAGFAELGDGEGLGEVGVDEALFG